MNKSVWNIVADENIPFVKELFSGFGEVHLRKGRDISAVDLENVDALLVRSVTQVNEALLQHSDVKFVGTCTIGIDHLDTAWLEKQGIAWASAPGCNAMGVVQYVLSCLAVYDLLEKQNKIAIVGCGNVGGRLYRSLKALGNDCVCIDPYKSREEFPDLGSMEDVFSCEVICLHTPLTKTGDHPTFHLISEDIIQRLRPGTVLLNAGRGAVVDNDALLKALQAGANLKAILDVWEPEPNINPDLLDRVAIGTPHIAGYSYEGKVNGSLMIFDALCQFTRLAGEAEYENLRARVCEQAFGVPENMQATTLTEAVLATYDVREDDCRLREATPGLPSSFDHLRKSYPKRREPKHFILSGPDSLYSGASAAGFTL